MIAVLILLLILLWILGYVHISGLVIPNIPLFTINSQVITLWDLLIVLILAGVIGILPSPFRQIAGIFLVLWILSVLGVFSILAFASLPAVILAVIIVGLIVYAFI